MASISDAPPAATARRVRSRRSNGALTAVVASAVFLTGACNAKPMTLLWQDTSDNEEGFRIYRVNGNDKQLIAQVGPNITRYVDKDAPPGACYIVTAFNAAGESPATNSVCQKAVR
jgi:hypothetical protein